MKVTRWQRLKWIIPLVLFFTTILDASLVGLFPKAFIGSKTQTITPHLTLYFLVTFAFFFRQSNIMSMSVITGLFYDIYNTTVMGVYGSLYFIVVYFVIKVKKYLPQNWFVAFLLYILAIFGLDSLVFLFFSNIGYSDLNMLEFIIQRLGPTLIFNVVLFLLMYWPCKKFFSWLGRDDYYIF